MEKSEPMKERRKTSITKEVLTILTEDIQEKTEKMKIERKVEKKRKMMMTINLGSFILEVSVAIIKNNKLKKNKELLLNRKKENLKIMRKRDFLKNRMIKMMIKKKGTNFWREIIKETLFSLKTTILMNLLKMVMSMVSRELSTFVLRLIISLILLKRHSWPIYKEESKDF